MSFGVGLGDVLKTSELCWKLFLGMRQAPGELKPLRAQIESLTHTLGIINDLWEANSSTDPSDESRKMSVNKQLSALNNILLQLRVLLEQAAPLSTGRKRDKFSWGGLKFSLFDVKDLQKIRQELSIHILGIDLLQHSFNTSAIAADRQAARDRDRIMALEHEATMKALQEKYMAVMAFQNNINLRSPNPDMGKEETDTHKIMAQEAQMEVNEDHHSGARKIAEPNHDISLTVNSNQLASVVVGDKNDSPRLTVTEDTADDRVMCPLCTTSIYHKDAAEHLKNDHSDREKEQMMKDPKFLERQIEKILEIVNS